MNDAAPRVYSTIVTQLPPVLPPPSATHGRQETKQASGATAAAQKSIFQRLWDRYSIRGQQHRIQTAESLFQAASRQAADP